MEKVLIDFVMRGELSDCEYLFMRGSITFNADGTINNASHTDTNTQDTIDYSSYTNKANINLTLGTAQVDLLNNNFASGTKTDTFYGIDNATSTHHKQILYMVGAGVNTTFGRSWCWYYFCWKLVLIPFMEKTEMTILIWYLLQILVSNFARWWEQVWYSRL